jgi:hypothetical protein
MHAANGIFPETQIDSDCDFGVACINIISVLNQYLPIFLCQLFKDGIPRSHCRSFHAPLLSTFRNEASAARCIMPRVKLECHDYGQIMELYPFIVKIFDSSGINMITGSPLAIASNTTFPNVSVPEGNINASQLA